MTDITKPELDEIEIFLHGDCDFFAVAMHRATGLPLVAATTSDELVHAWVEWPDGRVFDARGLRSLEDVSDEYAGWERVARIGIDELWAVAGRSRVVPEDGVAKAAVLAEKILATVMDEEARHDVSP